MTINCRISVHDGGNTISNYSLFIVDLNCFLFCVLFSSFFVHIRQVNFSTQFTIQTRLFDIRKKNPVDELLIDDGRCEDTINVMVNIYLNIEIM